MPEPAGRGNDRDGPQAENAAGWKPQSAPKSRGHQLPNPILLEGLGGVLPSLTKKHRGKKMGKKFNQGTCENCLEKTFVYKGTGICEQCSRYISGDVEYYEYIKSSVWKLKSYQAKRRALFVCQDCGKKSDRLEVHHITYARLGREHDDDLVVLCDTCHEKRHERSEVAKRNEKIRKYNNKLKMRLLE